MSEKIEKYLGAKDTQNWIMRLTRDENSKL